MSNKQFFFHNHVQIEKSAYNSELLITMDQNEVINQIDLQYLVHARGLNVVLNGIISSNYNNLSEILDYIKSAYGLDFMNKAVQAMNEQEIKREIKEVVET
jgi:hypothetical protein